MLDLIYITDWILHSQDRSDTQEYFNLFYKLMSYAKDMDYGDLVDFDKDLKKYSESFIFEAESTALEYIENDTFWDQLISRLAQRNTLTEHKVNTIHDIETEELFILLFPVQKINGAMNLMNLA